MTHTYVYDIYGLQTEELEKAKNWIEILMNVSFSPHDSSYMGGLYYTLKISDRESYELQKNYCDDEGWVEDKYKDLGVILKISEPKKPDMIRELLLNSLQDRIVHIRRSVITEKSPDNRWARDYQYVGNKDELISEIQLPALNWFKK